LQGRRPQLEEQGRRPRRPWAPQAAAQRGQGRRPRWGTRCHCLRGLGAASCSAAGARTAAQVGGLGAAAGRGTRGYSGGRAAAPTRGDGGGPARRCPPFLVSERVEEGGRRGSGEARGGRRLRRGRLEEEARRGKRRRKETTLTEPEEPLRPSKYGGWSQPAYCENTPSGLNLSLLSPKPNARGNGLNPLRLAPLSNQTHGWRMIYGPRMWTERWPPFRRRKHGLNC